MLLSRSLLIFTDVILFSACSSWPFNCCSLITHPCLNARPQDFECRMYAYCVQPIKDFDCYILFIVVLYSNMRCDVIWFTNVFPTQCHLQSSVLGLTCQVNAGLGGYQGTKLLEQGRNLSQHVIMQCF